MGTSRLPFLTGKFNKNRTFIIKKRGYLYLRVLNAIDVL